MKRTYLSYFVSLPLQADLSFRPSVGFEFITQMGVHIPDYVEARLQMHTNLYHESSLNVKLTIKKNQMRLSIPAPTSSTQLLSVRSGLLTACSCPVDLSFHNPPLFDVQQ